MKVSVITTLYNYRNYIEDCIKSFLDQGFVDSEMIIVDDASTDDPLPIIFKYIGEKIKYIRLKENKGYSYAKNIGIKESISEILVMLDADDMLTKNSISCRYNKIMEGYDLVHGPALDLKNNRTYKSIMWSQWQKSQSHKYVHAQTAMLKKDIHRKIGLYDESMWCKSDREMFARIFNHGFKIGTVNSFVSIYRHHKKQMHCSEKKIKINKILTKNLLKKIKIRKTDLTGLKILE
jgi:glycosyltransferase involved in cell wall biosynthesis